MKRETFIEAIEAIEKQIRNDIKFSEYLGKAFPDAHTGNLIPDNYYITNILIKILQEEMDDTELCEFGYSWIEWFCFETDFGNESYRLKAYNKDKTVIPMNNPAELYDYLNNRQR